MLIFLLASSRLWVFDNCASTRALQNRSPTNTLYHSSLGSASFSAMTLASSDKKALQNDPSGKQEGAGVGSWSSSRTAPLRHMEPLLPYPDVSDMLKTRSAAAPREISWTPPAKPTISCPLFAEIAIFSRRPESPGTIPAENTTGVSADSSARVLHRFSQPATSKYATPELMAVLAAGSLSSVD